MTTPQEPGTPHPPRSDLPDDPDVNPLAAPDGDEHGEGTDAGSAEELAVEHSDVLPTMEPPPMGEPDQSAL
jgi:hypothetical protein